MAAMLQPRVSGQHSSRNQLVELAEQQAQEQQKQARLQQDQQQALIRDLQYSQAFESAPSQAHPALRAVAEQLDLPQDALLRLADAVARNSRQITAIKSGWLSADAAEELVHRLKLYAALSPEDAGSALIKCPALLRDHNGADPRATLDVLLRHAYPSASSRSGAGGIRIELGKLLQSAPHVLRAPPTTVEANLEYLSSTLRLPPDVMRRAVAQHPTLLSHRPGAMSINMGFLVGLGANVGDLQGMMAQCPRWATMPLHDLTVKWQFFRQELKGTLEDLVLTPQLLQLSLLDTLGPRAGLARKKRVRLLMPSYSTGHPILKSPHEWAEHRMAPIRYWMTAKPQSLCKTMGLDPEELARYRDAWKMTTGDRWRRLVLSPTAGGGGDGKGGKGAKGGPVPQAELVMLPHLRMDERSSPRKMM